MAVDDPAVRDARAAARARATSDGRPGTCPTPRGARCPRSGDPARPARRRTRSCRRGARRAAPTSRRRRARRRAPARAAPRERSGSVLYARTASKPWSACSSGISGCSADSGSSTPGRTASSWPSPSGSAKRSASSPTRSVATPSAPRRCSQKSSASGDPTRDTIVWTMPAPGAAGDRAGVLEEGQLSARPPPLVGVEQVVDAGIVLVDRLGGQPEPEHARVEVEVLLRVPGDGGDVVEALESHSCTNNYSGSCASRQPLIGGRTPLTQRSTGPNGLCFLIVHLRPPLAQERIVGRAAPRVRARACGRMVRGQRPLAGGGGGRYEGSPCALDDGGLGTRGAGRGICASGDRQHHGADARERDHGVDAIRPRMTAVPASRPPATCGSWASRSVASPRTTSRSSTRTSRSGATGLPGHLSGFRIIDIDDPRNPKSADRLPRLRAPVGSGRHGRLGLDPRADVGRQQRQPAAGPPRTCDGEPVPSGRPAVLLGPAASRACTCSTSAIPATRTSSRRVDLTCGSHTATGVPDLRNRRLLVYSTPSSAALRGHRHRRGAAEPARGVRVPALRVRRSCGGRGEQLRAATTRRSSSAGRTRRPAPAAWATRVWSLGGKDGGSRDNPRFLYNHVVPEIAGRPAQRRRPDRPLGRVLVGRRDGHLRPRAGRRRPAALPGGRRGGHRLGASGLPRGPRPGRASRRTT